MLRRIALSVTVASRANTPAPPLNATTFAAPGSAPPMTFRVADWAADVANSAALGDDRVLWVFGDTLLGEPGVNRCDRFDDFLIPVHNSLALQHGRDPRTARVQHFWGRRDGAPDSFFSPPAGVPGWYWMGGVTVLDGQALVGLVSIGDLVKFRMDKIEAEAEAMLNYIQSV